MWNILLYIFTASNLLLYLYIVIATVRKWNISNAHRRFSFLVVLALFWLSAVYLMSYDVSFHLLEHLVHFNFSIAPLIATFFVLFIVHYPHRQASMSIIKEICIVLPLLIISILSYTDIFIKVKAYKIYEYSSQSIYYYIYIVVLFIYFFLVSSAVAYKKIKSLETIYKRQLVNVLIGYLIAIMILFFESLYTNLIQSVNPVIDRFILNTSMIFSILAAYAMLRYRFMDVRVVIRKGMVHGISLLLALVVYTYLALLLKNTIEQNWQVSPIWTIGILISLVAFGFPLLKNFIEKVVNILFKGEKSIDLAVKEIQEKMCQKTNMEALVDLISHEIRRFLGVDGVKLFILNHREQKLKAEAGGDQDTIELRDDMIRYLDGYPDVLIRDEIPHLLKDQAGFVSRELLQKTERVMKKLKISLVMPLKTEDELFGLLTIGEQAQNRVYTVQDVQYLEKIRVQVGSILAYALLYRDALERINSKTIDSVTVFN